jgi:hypothetical protein
VRACNDDSKSAEWILLDRQGIPKCVFWLQILARIIFADNSTDSGILPKAEVPGPRSCPNPEILVSHELVLGCGLGGISCVYQIRSLESRMHGIWRLQVRHSGLCTLHSDLSAPSRLVWPHAPIVRLNIVQCTTRVHFILSICVEDS